MRLGILVSVALWAALIPALTLAQGRPARVQTAVVDVREMIETITVFGQIVAVRESDVATRIAGVVNEIPVSVGSVVARGDALALLDTKRLGIELASAEAQLAIANAGLQVAQAQADRASRSLERANELTGAASISGAQLDDRASALAEAQGGIAQAKARIVAAENLIDLANYNLTNATVRAPFDGIVLDVATQVGQFASSGSMVAKLLDTETMEVEANVPSRYIEALKTGGAVEGNNDNGTLLNLTLRAVLPTESSKTRTRPVRFTFNKIDPSFAVGQAVTLAIPVGESREALVVPKDALVQARGGWTAFVNDDGKASPRQVAIGDSLGNAFEVLSGLAPGDEVVVRGNERLRPGQSLAPIGAAGPQRNSGTRPSRDANGLPKSKAAGSAPQKD